MYSMFCLPSIARLCRLCGQKFSVSTDDNIHKKKTNRTKSHPAQLKYFLCLDYLMPSLNEFFII